MVILFKVKLQNNKNFEKKFALRARKTFNFSNNFDNFYCPPKSLKLWRDLFIACSFSLRHRLSKADFKFKIEFWIAFGFVSKDFFKIHSSLDIENFSVIQQKSSKLILYAFYNYFLGQRSNIPQIFEKWKLVDFIFSE